MDYLDEYTDSDKEEVFTMEDYLNNDTTRNILDNEFFESFKVDMADKIVDFYNKKVYNSTIDYMDMFENDFDHRQGYDLFLTIYPFISKNYNFSIFDENPNLKTLLFKKEEEVVEEDVKKKVIEKKIYDWSAKKYK